MEQRFEVRRDEILSDAEIPKGIYERSLSRLTHFLKPFVGTLRRKELRGNATTYVQGLLSDLKRKNVESIAYRYGMKRHNLQHFIGASKWDYQPMAALLCQQVGDTIGEEDGVIIFDPSTFEKCGSDSAGVARQWLGRFGKVDNGQVGVYMAYASRKEHALCDARLYLPREWADDSVRREKCGIPGHIEFQTRHELCLEMLDLNGDTLPHAWITGDDEMGRSSTFRRELRKRKEQYILAVPSNTSIRDLEGPVPEWSGRGAPPKQPFQSVAEWREHFPADKWQRVTVRNGEKGPIKVQIAVTRVVAKTERSRDGGTEELLIVTRSRQGKGWKVDYYLSNADPATHKTVLARVARREHRIEDCFRRAKGAAGLADYEVRSWHGWYHHQMLSLIATWFLTLETSRGKKRIAGVELATGRLTD